MKYNWLAGLVVSSLAWSGMANAANTEFPQKKQIESIVHDYILNNPDVLVSSLERYQQKQIEQTKQTFSKIQNSTPKFANRLFHQSTDPVGGNPNGKITIVEFSDYQCPHCIEMSSILSDTVKKNDNLRVIFKEFPIRGPVSELASRAALASQKQGKYYEFHNALMESKTQPLTEATIYNIAQSVGLNLAQLKTDMKSLDIDAQIKNNYQLAKDMELIWTPVLFVAKTDVNGSAKPEDIIFIPGRVDGKQLDEVIGKVK